MMITVSMCGVMGESLAEITPVRLFSMASLEAPHDAIEDEIRLRINELQRTTDDHVAGEAARILFELAHFSNESSDRNKCSIAAGNGVSALCQHLRSESYEVRYQTCSALGELAFRNEENCLLVVDTPDALPALCEMLVSSAGNNQEDAALVINNCASFCEETAEKIVRCPGMLASLKALAVGRHVGAKNVAIGALNCLSRSAAVLSQLEEARVVEEALVPVLDERGRGEKHEVRRARAMMAVVNLTGSLPPARHLSLPPRHLSPPAHAQREKEQQGEAAGRRPEVGAMVRVLGLALEGKKWVGVSFTPYSVLYPLSRLAHTAQSRLALAECGVGPLLVRLVEEWQPGPNKAAASLAMALRVLEALAAHAAHPPAPPALRTLLPRLRARHCFAALHLVAAAGRGEGEEAAAAAERVVEIAGAGPVALWMGQHHRLGEKSLLLQLDEFAAGLVLDFAFLDDNTQG